MTNSIEGKRILITGGAGFIGSHLAEACLAAGAFVVITDDLSGSDGGNVPITRDCFNYHGNVINYGTFDRAVNDGVDIIFHLASPVGVENVKDNPTRTVLTNVIGTDNAVKWAKKAGAVLVFASSSEVYGMATEQDDGAVGMAAYWPLGDSRWSYAYAKGAAEFLVQDYENGINCRLFNVAGPRQKLDMVIPAFVWAALTGQPLQVHGDGRQVRSFIDVRDLVQHLINIATSEKAKRPLTRAINVGGGETFNIQNLARKIISDLGSNSKIEYTGLDNQATRADTMERRPLLGQLRNLSGYIPRHTMTDTIRAVAASLQQKADKYKELEL